MIYIFIILSIFATQIICNGRYQEHPDQEQDPVIKNKDYTNLEFQKDWNRDYGYFTVKKVSMQEYDKIWQGQTRDFRGDNFHTISLKAKQSATLAEYAYEAIPMTKAVMNYHCSNPKSSKPRVVQFMVFDHNHRVYHEETNFADTIVVDFKQPTDARIRLYNPSNSRINCFITSECVECGKFHHRLMNREEFRQKLNRILQLNRYIGVSCRKVICTNFQLGNYEVGPLDKALDFCLLRK